jgi:hypothetical protein
MDQKETFPKYLERCIKDMIEIFTRNFFLGISILVILFVLYLAKELNLSGLVNAFISRTPLEIGTQKNINTDALTDTLHHYSNPQQYGKSP